ncbi:MAG: uracil-DNA glycosylase family protein [Sphingomonas sp.]|jgi:uracil-DNA glycosylase|uniref:uracil-DNA glycosylase family protein n=1 Tax=Sphingomonas sp. TaxID=28214 RepID=UPI0035674F31
MIDDAASLLREISACTFCVPHLPLGPRPVVQFSASSRILIIGQAPGTKVHASGVPWQDDSGDRLREWTGIDSQEFYDPAKVALVPMGFCYPGKAAGGDAPPRPECAPRWHERILELLPADRLTLLVGSYAQQRYLSKDAGATLTDRVRAFERFAPIVFPTPHPSWRSKGWQKRNPWFEAELLPKLRAAVRRQLDRA